MLKYGLWECISLHKNFIRYSNEYKEVKLNVSQSNWAHKILIESCYFGFMDSDMKLS